MRKKMSVVVFDVGDEEFDNGMTPRSSGSGDDRHHAGKSLDSLNPVFVTGYVELLDRERGYSIHR